MATTDGSGPVVPRKAPPPPENLLLRHYAWAPMWIENSNVVAVFVGDPGDGKSWGSLRCAESVDPEFTIDQVAWDIVDFMELVRDDSYGQGRPIVLEEGSVEASAYDWHSISNAVFRTVLDTWRNQNRMAIINLPSFGSLEKGARRRTDFIVEMFEAKPWKEFSQGKFKLVNYNNIDDHFSTPFPILEGKQRKFIRWSRPSRELREAYEQKKQDYSDELNEELYEKLISQVRDEEDDDMSPQEIADDILTNQDVDEFIGEYNNRRFVDSDLIELEYDIGARISGKVKKLLEKEVEV